MRNLDRPSRRIWTIPPRIPPPAAHWITDQEIEALLEGIQIETVADADSTEIPDELPVDEDALAEMKFLAGTDNVLETPHTVMVYTSTEAKARQLARRFETLWRWNIKFFRMLNVPVQMPEHKLEIYYFGTYEEFNTHSVNTSGSPATGALGYFMPTNNRTHFFDMVTYPPAAQRLEMAKDTRRPVKARRRDENIVNRWAEYQTMSTTQHEIGHQIHFGLGLFPRDAILATYEGREVPDPLPRWLIEGMTMMFEVPLTSAGASLGVVNHSRLDEFRRRHNPNSPVSVQWMKTFVLSNGFWHSGYFYPEGWALVYYLRKQKFEGFAKFMHFIVSIEPGEEITQNQLEKEFEDCFGKIDEDWIKEWYDFIFGLRFKKSLLPVELNEP